ETFDDFECRGRNRVAGAKLSEHGKGNAVDVRSFVLADGRSIGLTDISVAKGFRDEIRDSACHRFTTVLGPGADAQHESHIHLDSIERAQGYRMCQWDVREPAKTEVAAQVPLPPPRPPVPVTR
ncbi:MAG TPA: extensin family protein, partial [Pirellulales bacterium]|nr:extensin family protein [Pirellulales bacterium]